MSSRTLGTSWIGGELGAGDPLHSALDDRILNAQQFRDGCVQGISG
jgi:hypothetical protein